MASYFPPRASLSPRLSPSSPANSDMDSALSTRTVSPRVSARESLSPRSPRESLSPRSPTLLSQRGTIKRVVKKMVHDKIKSNDWNLVLDDVLKHLKKHGVTTKLIDMLHEHEWETVHHVLRRALLIFAVRWEAKHVMAVFVLLEHLKKKFGSEIEAVKEDLKRKVRELVQDEHALEELKEYLL